MRNTVNRFPVIQIDDIYWIGKCKLLFYMFHDMFLKMVSFTLKHVDVRLMGIRIRFTSLLVYWDHRFKSNLCQGETTSFIETHTRFGYGFCQDSGPDLSVVNFVITFTTMSSVISPRISTGNIGSIF